MLLEIHENAGFRSKKQTANEYASPCPACGGRDRFVIFLSEDRFWCRQCDKKGDALQYLRDFQKMSYQEAAAMVGKTLSPLTGKSHPSTPRTTTTAPTEPAKVKPPLWRERAAKGIQRAHAALMDNADALAWLRQERGITAETAERFRLGWLADNHFFQKSEFGLPSNGKKMLIPAGLVIPWQDKRIRVRRCNDEDAAKYGRYYVVPGSDTAPMTIGTPHHATAVIVESELDAILLCQEVKRPLYIVAMGSAAIKPSPELLERLVLSPVLLVALDNDAAGAKASSWWTKNLPGASRTLTPKQYGKDFTEAFLHGLDLNEWMGAALEVYVEQLLGDEGHEVTGNHFEKVPW